MLYLVNVETEGEIMNIAKIKNDNDGLANDLWFEDYLNQAYGGDEAYDEIVEHTYKVTIVNSRY